MTQGVFSVIDQASHPARMALPDSLTSVPQIKDAWLAAKLASPSGLSGLEVEFKVISVYSRGSGVRTGKLQFAVEAVQDLNVPAGVLAVRRRVKHESRAAAANLEFECLPARGIR